MSDLDMHALNDPEDIGVIFKDEAPNLLPREVAILLEHPVGRFNLPEEALVFEPSDVDIIHEFDNGDRERKIHCNSYLTDEERKNVRAFYTLQQQENIHFSPFVASCVTRYISRSRDDVPKALRLAKATHEWRIAYYTEPLKDTDFIEHLSKGMIYFSGRDNALRPLLIVRANRISKFMYENIDFFIKMLVFIMEYMMRYMMVPGIIENLSVLVDLEGVTPWRFPVGLLNKIYNVLSSHFVGRVYRFYVINTPRLISTLISVVKAFLTDRQKQKVVMLTADSMDQITNHFAPTQLEKEYGGIREKVTKFYPIDMPPGPFDVHCPIPSHDSAPDVHQVLTDMNSVGKLMMDAKPTEPVSPHGRIVWNTGSKLHFEAAEKRIFSSEYCWSLRSSASEGMLHSMQVVEAEKNEREKLSAKNRELVEIGTRLSNSVLVQEEPCEPTPHSGPAKPKQIDTKLPTESIPSRESKSPNSKDKSGDQTPATSAGGSLNGFADRQSQDVSSEVILDDAPHEGSWGCWYPCRAR